MKANKIKLVIGSLLVGYSVMQAASTTFKAKVDKATVFLSGAQLFSSHDINIGIGTTDIIFEGVAPKLQQNSLQASGKGNFVIMDVKFDAIYPEQTLKQPETKVLKSMKLLNDSITEVKFQSDELNDKLTALHAEKNILLNNRLIKGETKRDTLNMFKDAMEYLRTRQANINAEIYKTKRELNVTTQMLTLMNERLTALTNIANQVNENKVEQVANYRVIVTVMTEIATTGSVSINYFVSEASWVPEYDIRANNANNTVQLTQKARITQTSGTDWNNTSITLATAAPMQSTIKPNLSPAYLSFYRAVIKNTIETLSKMPSSKAQMDVEAGNEYNVIDDFKPAQSTIDFTSVMENMIQTEYEIKLKYQIPSDGMEHLVLVQNKDIKADYNFSAIPKLDGSAYLIAKVTDWEDLNLIPGQARIYFDGSYLGQSYIDPNTTNDTMQLSLGRDKGIVISRKRLKDKTKERILLEEKNITITYEITVKNTKNIAVDLNVEDQIPLAADQNIVIKLLENSKAKYNNETGSMEWNLNLKPKETRKLSFTYEVKIPKDKSIAGL